MYIKSLSKNKLLQLFNISVLLLLLSSCYKLEDLTPNFEDAHSTVVYDLPGDTLATDGWEQKLESGDIYLRQRYYTSRWTDSIRFVPIKNEIINAAEGIEIAQVDMSAQEWKDAVLAREAQIKWLPNATVHPANAVNNNAYLNTQTNLHYIRRSNHWYQMEIKVNFKEEDRKNITINWRGFSSIPPAAPSLGWAYRDNENFRVYRYNGMAWELITNNANYNENKDFVQVQFGKSGKEAGKYSIFLFRFKDGWQQFIRDAADSARYLKTSEWDIAFTGEMNSTIFLNNGRNNIGPSTGSPITKSSLIMYNYGYDFMNEAPEDEFFDNRPAENLLISYTSQFGPGVNSWYEYGSTFIAKPFPYRAYYLRLEQADGTYLYGKMQLISMYKGAPEVLTDPNWPNPYMTFRFFIQNDGSRNLKTKN